MFSVILKLLSPVTTCVIALIQYFRTKKSEAPWFKEILVWIFIGAFIISTSTILSDYTTQKELKKQNVSLLTNLIILRGQNDSLITKNDSLVAWIAGLKASASHQDTISEEALKYKIKAEKPEVILDELKLTDKYSADSLYEPDIMIMVTNIGKRVAERVSYRVWVITSDFSQTIVGATGNQEPLLPDPGRSHVQHFYPLLGKKILPIYLCLEIKYYDKQIKMPIQKIYYRKYTETGWWHCENTTSEKLTFVINEHASPKIKP